MCGILGKVTWTPGQTVPLELMQKMAQTICHRGPDEGGATAKGSWGLAMRRLKIIDLVAGQQPMTNDQCPRAGETGPLCLVYNGEVYGFQALRAELEARGHAFKSHSDTEVILHAFEEYGEGFLDHINGMFGLALYVEKEKTLYVARDRMGIKPLYYRDTPKSFAFASEIKALLADPETSREWDAQSINEYFSLRYIPTPRSVFKDIKKLEPGHMLKVRAGRIEKKSYWPFSPGPAPARPLAYYMEKLDGLLQNAVRSHMVSDVPLGVFLSGGLDSTTVGAYVSGAGKRLDSFTIYFAEQSFSERHEAALVAKQYGFNHHEMEMSPLVPDLAPRLADTFDEPFADPSVIPTYLLCQFTRQFVTVALSGDGGDELFGGYPTYIADRMAGVYRRFPRLVQKTFERASRLLPVSHQRISLDYRTKAFLRAANRPQPWAHFGWQEMFRPEDKTLLFTPEFLNATRAFDPAGSFVAAYTEAEARNELERMLFVDQRTHLMDEYLVKVDRLSMAHSLEVRVPLLDRAIVEFAAEIPPVYKLHGLTTKYIMRRLMENRLPKGILKGAKKGFSPPLAHWLVSDLREWAAGVLSPERVRATGILNPRRPLELLDEHIARKRDNVRQLWTLLSFMLWFERYGKSGLG